MVMSMLSAGNHLFMVGTGNSITRYHITLYISLAKRSQLKHYVPMDNNKVDIFAGALGRGDSASYRSRSPAPSGLLVTGSQGLRWR